MNDAKYPGSPGGVACFHLDKDDNKILLFKILKLSHKTNQFELLRSLLRMRVRAKMIDKGGGCTTGCDERELCV
jgi:hypothetical protein